MTSFLPKINYLFTIVLSILKCIIGDIFTGSSGDDLKVFNDTWNNFVFKTTVLTFGILSDCDQINIFIRSVDAFD